MNSLQERVEMLNALANKFRERQDTRVLVPVSDNFLTAVRTINEMQEIIAKMREALELMSYWIGDTDAVIYHPYNAQTLKSIKREATEALAFADMKSNETENGD